MTKLEVATNRAIELCLANGIDPNNPKIRYLIVACPLKVISALQPGESK